MFGLQECLSRKGRIPLRGLAQIRAATVGGITYVAQNNAAGNKTQKVLVTRQSGNFPLAAAPYVSASGIPSSTETSMVLGLTTSSVILDIAGCSGIRFHGIGGTVILRVTPLEND